MGCDLKHKRLYNCRKISIHAPIVGCDTFEICYKVFKWHYFNPRTHRGVRLLLVDDYVEQVGISIHAPIVGCDKVGRYTQYWVRKFQSTHPSWGATLLRSSTWILHNNFNPRTHRGVRLFNLFPLDIFKRFQSTHPSWGATALCYLCSAFI